MVARSIDYYSTWSVVFSLILLIIGIMTRHSSKNDFVTRSCLSSLFVNATTVGIMGAFVLAFGSIEGTERLKHRSNFMLHALPAFLATLLFLNAPMRLKYRDLVITIFTLVVFQCIYFVVPSSGGKLAFDKIEALYSCPPTMYISTFLFVQFLLISMLIDKSNIIQEKDVQKKDVRKDTPGRARKIT